MASKKKTVFNHDLTRFNLSKMGVQPVKNHCKSVGHKKMICHTSSMDTFVVTKTKTEQPDQQVDELRIANPPKQQGEHQEKKAAGCSRKPIFNK